MDAQQVILRLLMATIPFHLMEGHQKLTQQPAVPMVPFFLKPHKRSSIIAELGYFNALLI